MTRAMDRGGVDSPAARRPWLKFYPSDWRGDELLVMCSLGARGLLIEFIGLMHVAQPRGYLLVNGHAPTDQELVRLVRAGSVAELRRCRAELVDHGVLSVDAHGAIYSRRMVRDGIQSAAGHEAGKRGGNPALMGSGTAVRPLRVTHKATLKGQANPHIPEARCQSTPLPPRGGEPSAAETADRPPQPVDAADAFVGLWHEVTTVPLPRVQALTAQRRRHIAQRLKDRPLEAWRLVMARVQASAFCRGANDRAWRASLDWLIKSPDNAVKVLEGKYDDLEISGGVDRSQVGDVDATQRYLADLRGVAR